MYVYKKENLVNFKVETDLYNRIDSTLDTCILQVQKLYNTESEKVNNINYIIDQLNSIIGALLSPSSETLKDKFKLVLTLCFQVVKRNETLLVAKLSQLLLYGLQRLGIQLNKPLLLKIIDWCLEALQQIADISLIDILQALEHLIQLCTNDITDTLSEKILSSLDINFESKVKLINPQEVKLWRLQCLTALAPAVSKCQARYLNILKQFLQHKPELDNYLDIKVLICVVTALDVVCQSNRSLLLSNLADVLGVTVTCLHFGLPGWQPQPPPWRLMPLTAEQWEPPPNPKTRRPRRRHVKKRLSNINGGGIGGVEAERGEYEGAATSQKTLPSYMQAPTAKTLVSDSEPSSDSEGGNLRKLKKTQARLRLAAINLLVSIAKTLSVRDLFGYYSILVGQQGLQFNLIHERISRVSAVTASALAFLLGNARANFAQAQYSNVASFTPFSNSLASLLESLHTTILKALGHRTAVMATLQCASCIVDVSPYPRLKPGLLQSLLTEALPYTNKKDVDEAVAAVTLLGCVIAAEPHSTDKIIEFLSVPQPPVQLESVPDTNTRAWVLTATLNSIKNETHVSLHVEWWQVMVNLISNYYDLVKPHIDEVYTAITTDLDNKSEHVQLHAARAFEQLATSLASSDENKEECVRIWRKILQSSLLKINMNSPNLSAVVCDCLKALTSTTYEALPENLKICCITFLLYCANDEEPSSQSAGIMGLINFISYPVLLEDEDFMFRCSDIFCRLVGDKVPLVSNKAIWALGDLTDMLYKKQYVDFDKFIQPTKLVKTILKATENSNKSSGVHSIRALGNVMGLLNDRHLSHPELQNLPSKAADVLLSNAHSTFIKISWNACYALGSMMKNEANYKGTLAWQGPVIDDLCGLIKTCENFKVCTNAALALSCIPSRQHFGPDYLKVWKAVLNGLSRDYDLSSTHFKEAKHKESLFQQLCLTICHLSIVMEVKDMTELYDLLGFHTENVKMHMYNLFKSGDPEKKETLRKAVSNLFYCLDRQENITTSDSQMFKMLFDVLICDE